MKAYLTTARIDVNKKNKDKIELTLVEIKESLRWLNLQLPNDIKVEAEIDDLKDVGYDTFDFYIRVTQYEDGDKKPLKIRLEDTEEVEATFDFNELTDIIGGRDYLLISENDTPNFKKGMFSYLQFYEEFMTYGYVGTIYNTNVYISHEVKPGYFNVSKIKK